MQQPFYPDEARLRVGVTAQLARQYSEDADDFFQSLAILLETMLPGTARIEKRGKFLSRKKAFRITVPTGENRLILENESARVLRATHTRIVKGITLKTEEISVQEWLEELGETLQASAKSNQAARDALASFVDF